MQDATFVVAVSGGADSVSLLLAIDELRRKKKLRLEFVVAHFNHALRGKESDKDEKFVRGLAERAGFAFESERWKRGKGQAGENLEQAARDARYQFLEKLAIKHRAVVLTAHTMDDQAETFLMRMIRGSGTDGLGAIRSTSMFGGEENILLVRPLLDWARRSDTQGFCRFSGVKYREDPMNKDQAFFRVKIRRQLIPQLQKLNPQIVPTLAKTAELLQCESAELDNHVRFTYRMRADANNEMLDLNVLKQVPVGIRARYLRVLLGERRGGLRQLGMKHFAALERLVLSGTGGKTVELPGGERVSVVKGRLIFTRTKVEKSGPEH